MNTQRLSLVLTVLNLILLAFILVYLRPASTGAVAPVLRAHAFELVDEQGKVRAQLIVVPPSTMPDGQKYPETSLFRLIDLNGRPGVKISTSVDGSGLTLAGDSEHTEWNGVQILAEAAGSSMKLTNKDGSEKLVKP